MTASLTIRRYRPADADRVRELNELAMREVGAFVEGASDDDLAAIEETYLESDGEFLVGEVDGRVVATGAYKPADGYVTDFLEGVSEETAEITRMRVDPTHQRNGYGTAMLEELERRARECDFTAAVLDTTPVQTGAIALYEGQGYEEVHRERVDAFDEPFVMVFYRKSLE